MSWRKQFKDVNVTRYRKEELYKAIEDLEKRGFYLVKILTDVNSNDKEHLINNKRLVNANHTRTGNNLANGIKHIAVMRKKQ